MTRTLLTITLGASLASLALPSGALAGRGGGYGGRGGGYGGGGMERGGEAGGMNRPPSMSQPRPQSGGSNAAPAAAGAGYANRNQSPNHPNAAPAAAGAAGANRNDTPNHPNAAPAAAGAGYANRNDTPNHPNAAPAAAGAGYANRNNSSQYPNAAPAAAGAAYANRNNNQYPYGAAAAGAGMGAAYANNNNGYWNGNYGNGSLGSYGGMGMASPAYGYGSSGYVNPYMGTTGTGVGAGGGNNGQGGNGSYDYSQPLNTAAAAPADATPPADPSTTPAAQAHQAFQNGDYAGAVQLTQQALGQAPNDPDLHQFLALGLFAQGQYEKAAAPLYAVLAVGPGWDWTTLISNYADASAYTQQLRGLEAFSRANPRSANAEFVLAYQYISQGHQDSAIRPLQAVVALQPNDGVSAQLLERLQPPAPASLAKAFDPTILPGVWVAQAPPNATITLTLGNDGNFAWAIAAPGKPASTIKGPYSLSNNVLTLSGQGTPGGPLVGKVASTDDSHMTFKAVGAPASDPGLQFAR